MRRKSLISTLIASLVLPGALSVMIGTFIVFTVVREEYGELQDIELAVKSQLLLQLYQTTVAGVPGQGADTISGALDIETSMRDEGERSLFWVLDAEGGVVETSPGAKEEILPDDLTNGFHTANKHRFHIVRAEDDPPVALVVGVPLLERNTTVRDAVLGVLFGFLLLSSIFIAIAFWSIRRSVGVIENLARNISEKGEHNLSPIDRNNSFAEIEPAIDTLDMLMARLDTALSAERDFATNAAHELRTPVAVAIAQLQRLRASLKDAAALPKIAETEAALKRLARLTERLLQLSRTQSGLGRNASLYDVREVLCLLLNDLRQREPSHEKLQISFPLRECITSIDPDALGIILNNLFDNALKYASGPTPIVVDASETCRIEVSNDCDALSAEELEAVKRRFIRSAPLTDGFGLGLSIVRQLCDQSGCTLDIMSPRAGQDRGFTALLRLPSQGDG